MFFSHRWRLLSRLRAWPVRRNCSNKCSVTSWIWRKLNTFHLDILQNHDRMWFMHIYLSIYLSFYLSIHTYIHTYICVYWYIYLMYIRCVNIYICIYVYIYTYNPMYNSATYVSWHLLHCRSVAHFGPIWDISLSGCVIQVEMCLVSGFQYFNRPFRVLFVVYPKLTFWACSHMVYLYFFSFTPPFHKWKTMCFDPSPTSTNIPR